MMTQFLLTLHFTHSISTGNTDRCLQTLTGAVFWQCHYSDSRYQRDGGQVLPAGEGAEEVRRGPSELQVAWGISRNAQNHRVQHHTGQIYQRSWSYPCVYRATGGGAGGGLYVRWWWAPPQHHILGPAGPKQR